MTKDILIDPDIMGKVKTLLEANIKVDEIGRTLGVSDRRSIYNFVKRKGYTIVKTLKKTEVLKEELKNLSLDNL